MPRKNVIKKYNFFQRNKDLFSKLYLLFALILLLIGSSVLSSLSGNLSKVKSPVNFAEEKNIESTKVISNTPIKINPLLMKDSNISEIPTRIIIPRINIDISITESQIKDGYWEVSDNSASHGMGSANPGQQGNSVIFAHARVGLFYNLKDIQNGDDVYILTKDKWYHYKASEVTSVYPDQVEVISPTKDKRLTLYTCTGYADEKRLIVVAKPI